MTVPFERLKVRLLSNPAGKAEHDALEAGIRETPPSVAVRTRIGNPYLKGPPSHKSRSV